jgi:hypothetical protein
MPEMAALLADDLGEGELSSPPAPCDAKLVATTFVAPGFDAEVFRRCGTGGGGGGTGEGVANANYVVSEREFNDNIPNANIIPLGFGVNERNAIDVTGRLSPADFDFFGFHLKGGDIIGVTANGAGDLSLQDDQGNELIGGTGDNPLPDDVFPLSSSLPVGGATTIQAVIPRDGDYYLSVGIGNGPYRAFLRVFRPVLATQGAVNQHQIIYLDFNGAVVDQSIFSDTLTGVARLSPMNTFLNRFGLNLQNEREVTDAIIAGFTKHFERVRVEGQNGDYFSTGIAGQYDFEVRNSRDHLDPWGLPNVSRVVVGGTQQQLGIPTIGISESVDPGNFDTTETAVVLLDILSDPGQGVATVRRAPGVSYIKLIGDLVGSIAAHEAGHFFGNFHTDPFNQSPQIMDSGAGGYENILGAGPDLTVGTFDDIDVGFTSDFLFTQEFFTGLEETGNVISWGLSTGLIPTSVRGVVWQDTNGNGIRENHEPGIRGWTVFADLDKNGLFEGREPSAITDVNGNYVLFVPPGQYTISEVVQGTSQQTFPKTNLNLAGVYTHKVALAMGQRVDNIDFGNFTRPNVITGYKYQDVNGNGVDDNEPRLSGFIFYLDRDGDGRLDTGEPADTTDNNGVFRIETSEIGRYFIREAPSPGFVQTQPANNAGYDVLLEGGSLITDLVFGNAGPLVDFGDAPDPYPTRLADDGARAAILANFHLGPPTTAAVNPGVGVDVEADGQPSVGATDDDANGVDDEDGISFSPMIVGQSARVTVVVTVGAGIPRGALQGWIDFNFDGDWNDPGEQIIRNLPLGNGTHQVEFSVPANALPVQTYARFRYGYETDLGPTGFSAAGEVEDYLVQVLNDQPRAVDDQFTGANGVRQNSSQNVLNVLANDIASSAGGLTISALSSPSNGGTVSIDTRGTATPTDDVVRYTPAIGFIGVETFTYTIRDAAQRTSTGTVTVEVLSNLTGPVAVDDSFNVAAGTIVNLNVLANDLAGPRGPISIFGFNDPTGQLSISTVNNQLRVTVPVTLDGQDLQFSYTVVDSGNPVQFNTATVTLHIGNSSQDDIVALTVQPTDLNGNPILSINPGQNFQLRVFVQDLRASDGNTNPLDDLRGVFAAYTDLLYSSSLVSISGQLGYVDPFDSGKSGDIATLGLVNELGAFRSLNAPPGGGPGVALFATIPMRANSIGEAKFALDPADDLPAHNTLLYEPPGPVAFNKITYGTTSLFIGKPEDVLFRAVDDTFEVPGNATSQLDVKANDLLATQLGKVVSISNSFQLLTNPFNGTVALSNDGNFVRYTPNSGFVGADQFRYTLVDQNNVTTSAIVTLFVGAGNHNDDLVEIRYQATDLNGNVISSTNVGEQFLLQAFVRDLRTTDPIPATQTDERGVFAVYSDTLFNFKLATPVPLPITTNSKGFDITYPAEYQSFTGGSAAIPGLIDEAGALQSGTSGGSVVSPLGPGSFLVWQTRMLALAAGDVTFRPDPADVRGTGSHEILLHEPPGVVPVDKVNLIPTTIRIIGASGEGDLGRHNSRNANDVNDDGFVAPIDALLVIRELNQKGSHDLTPRGADGYYLDVYMDGQCTPLDALSVINYLNHQARLGGAEGEAGTGLLGMIPDSIAPRTPAAVMPASSASAIPSQQAVDALLGANVIAGSTANRTQMASTALAAGPATVADDLLADLANDVLKSRRR